MSENMPHFPGKLSKIFQWLRPKTGGRVSKSSCLPPFGVGYYAACAKGRMNPDEDIGPIIGYMVALLIGVNK